MIEQRSTFNFIIVLHLGVAVYAFYMDDKHPLDDLAAVCDHLFQCRLDNLNVKYSCKAFRSRHPPGSRLYFKRYARDNNIGFYNRWPNSTKAVLLGLLFLRSGYLYNFINSLILTNAMFCYIMFIGVTMKDKPSVVFAVLLLAISTILAANLLLYNQSEKAESPVENNYENMSVLLTIPAMEEGPFIKSVCFAKDMLVINMSVPANSTDYRLLVNGRVIEAEFLNGTRAAIGTIQVKGRRSGQLIHFPRSSWINTPTPIYNLTLLRDNSTVQYAVLSSPLDIGNASEIYHCLPIETAPPIESENPNLALTPYLTQEIGVFYYLINLD